MKLELENKVFVVTGGASGIGESVVRRLVAAGATACVLDRNQDAMLKLQQDEEITGGNVLMVLTELTEIESCRKALEQVLTKYERIDGLVNNAGLNDGVGLEQGSYEGFIASLHRNVGHYYTMAQLSLPALKRSRGTIVNICSKVAETGQGGTSGYAAANGARLELTSHWAEELIPDHIRVNAVVVAECWTPQYKWWVNQQPFPENVLRRIHAGIPLERRMTNPSEIADTVLFLLSPKSGSVNGEFFHVDGGYVHLDRGINKQ